MVSHSIQGILNTFTELLPKETSIAIANQKNFIYYQPSDVIDLHIEPGDEIKKGSATYQALLLKRKIFTLIDESVFGTSYYGLSVPILNKGKPNVIITAILPVMRKLSLPHFLTIKNDDRWFPVSMDKILYLEAENRKAKVVTNDLKGFHKYSLSILETFLPTDKFIRCHRSFIVNINQIQEIQPDFHSTFLLIMNNGDRVPVSQKYASSFRRHLMF
ncbi:LytTR family DNA-binding domain-containing protein [Fervidibacillus halotolerans]|uniref:LytTR family transcriptional regulator DNA-binding domain-containing protein n=1 Tax=Fervidibacillus halotolerans TaxID=2980027 RepID=A0A9E8RWY8_9BACI|nr:LytTR family DNA-binding domain-containing protein [Fervidibacillus halotolerans]WAA12240.1 LytTR family transcriptional regulator DNA-binding domain-containing protein [Fervidibacillus halotolerans]